jgi:hypothetical protein
MAQYKCGCFANVSDNLTVFALKMDILRISKTSAIQLTSCTVSSPRNTLNSRESLNLSVLIMVAIVLTSLMLNSDLSPLEPC